jgi:FtsP/CotA-like multicopper oxidase with cupredoxin domain
MLYGDGTSYLLSMLVVVAGFGVMVLLLRWTFSSGKSVVQRRPRQGGEHEYGLFVPVASPGTMIEGEQLRLRLAAAQIRAQLVQTKDGPRLMVFEKDEKIARTVLTAPPPPPSQGL